MMQNCHSRYGINRRISQHPHVVRVAYLKFRNISPCRVRYANPSFRNVNAYDFLCAQTLIFRSQATVETSIIKNGRILADGSEHVLEEPLTIKSIPRL